MKTKFIAVLLVLATLVGCADVTAFLGSVKEVVSEAKHEIQQRLVDTIIEKFNVLGIDLHEYIAELVRKALADAMKVMAK